MTNPSDWTPTEADALPWGEVVEVKCADGAIQTMQPAYGPRWIEYSKGGWFTEPLAGTEWRRSRPEMERIEAIRANLAAW